MRGRIAAALAGLIFVAGCAVYDQSAVPSAGAALDLAMEQCTANARAGTYSGLAMALECELAADGKFAAAIKLRKMDLYDAYAGRMRLIGQQFDAKLVTFEQANAGVQNARRSYIASIMQAEEISQAERMQAAAALGGMGAAMERAADRQAVMNAANRPLNCTSTKFGNQVNTTCN